MNSCVMVTHIVETAVMKIGLCAKLIVVGAIWPKFNARTECVSKNTYCVMFPITVQVIPQSQVSEQPMMLQF